MDPRERVFATLDHEEPDRVPLFDFVYESKSFENILGKKGVTPYTPRDYVRGHLALGLDLLVANVGESETFVPKRPSSDTIIDEWGIRSKITEEMQVLPWYLSGSIEKPEDLENYQVPDPHAPGRMKYLESVMKLAKDKIVVSTSAGCPFSRAWGLCSSMSLFLKWVYTSPNTVKKLLEISTNYDLEIGKRCIDAGVEIIWICDDLGYNTGLFLSPLFMRKCVLPCIEREVRTFKRRGAKVLLHCDGDVRLILGDLVKTGIDGFHPMERSAGMDIRQIKQTYGDEICLIGNVENKHLLPFGTIEEIAEQTRECIEIAAPGGGYMFASDHSIHPRIPYRKAKFMFDLAKKYGVYPKRVCNSIGFKS